MNRITTNLLPIALLLSTTSVLTINADPVDKKVEAKMDKAKTHFKETGTDIKDAAHNTKEGLKTAGSAALDKVHNTADNAHAKNSSHPHRQETVVGKAKTVNAIDQAQKTTDKAFTDAKKDIAQQAYITTTYVPDGTSFSTTDGTTEKLKKDAYTLKEKAQEKAGQVKGAVVDTATQVKDKTVEYGTAAKDKAVELATAAKDKVANTAHDVKEVTTDAASQIGQKAAHAGQVVKEKTLEAKEQAGNLISRIAQKTKAKFNDLFKEVDPVENPDSVERIRVELDIIKPDHSLVTPINEDHTQVWLDHIIKLLELQKRIKENGIKNYDYHLKQDLINELIAIIENPLAQITITIYREGILSKLT